MDNYKTTALIGYTGFVGSNLHLKYNFTHVYNSKNIGDIIGKNFDCVVCAGISAMKWWANLHPEEDLENINKLLDVLKTISAKKFILVSTIDVYGNCNDYGDEDMICANDSPYGKNRYYVETFIKNLFNDYLIIRLPGLFGYGLKKNIIYDYLNLTLKELNIKSSFQWYNISNLFTDINKILNIHIDIVNLFTEPICNEDLHNLFCKYGNVNYTLTDKNLVNYNVGTKYGGYWDSKLNILAMIDNYINNMLNSKLTISNLSWKHNDNKLMLQNLEMFGIKCLEVSPHKYLNGETNKKLDIYSFQAILYPHTFNIFVVPDIVINYLNGIIEIAGKLGVKVLVFGSPKNRCKNNLSYDNAMILAVDFFKKVSYIAEKSNVIIVIEPNAKCYGCDFITNSVEGRDLVLKVNSPFFKLHLDTGCMFLENENIMESIYNNLDILEHIHFSAPGLKSLLDNKDLDYNKLFLDIKKIYGKMISIEMLGLDDLDVLRNVKYVLG